MSNIIDANGITTNTREEVITLITEALKDIYGDDINVDSSTPDGQLINIFAQSIIDVSDLLVQVYNSFDPDRAVGTVLDQRCAINGIQRIGATFTFTNITVTTDRAVNLAGLDSLIDEEDGSGFTVADSNGNKWILAATTSIGAAGSHVLAFRAQFSGAVTTTPNTITTIISTVLGVTAVNNPTTYTTLGINEETDESLRMRRQQSVSLASQGYLASLLAEIKNIAGVTYAAVYENTSSSTDGDGIPGHSIWAIVEGGDNDDIAYAIYTKRNAGCGMKGAVEVDVAQPDNSAFTIKFDRTTTQPLYVKFDAKSINGIDAIDSAYIKAQIVSLLSLDVNESVNINQIASLIQQIDSNCLATSILLSSDDSNWFSIVDPTAKNYRFTVSASDIDITVV